MSMADDRGDKNESDDSWDGSSTVLDGVDSPNPPADHAGPDWDALGSHAKSALIQLLRLRHVVDIAAGRDDGVKQRNRQEIIHLLERVKQHDEELRTLRSEALQLAKNENSWRQRHNQALLQANSSEPFLPLLDLNTRTEIADCPRTPAEIADLSPAQANRILRALQLRPPLPVKAKRTAVQRALTGHCR